ncbi:TPA: hypothetical protein HA246_01765 [Candidatus Woesearchaeota archaeon]|nr:hypothetical protein [Candidatus Woesearchaeota archaeon]
MTENNGKVVTPRVILSGLEFKIGQSLQLRFVRPGTNPPSGYDATIGMSSVDAIYQDGKELWKNMNCQNPSPLPVKGLQVVFSEDTRLEFQETHPKFRVNGVMASYGDYIAKVFDQRGNIHYNKNGSEGSQEEPQIISILDGF